MNKAVIIGIIIILVLAAGTYIERHKIKSMLGMSPTPQMQTQSKTSNSSSSVMAPSNNIYMTKDSSKGKYLTDFQGMTLYTYDKDTKNVSNCSGQCAKIWPIYTSGATAEKMLPTNITVITRSDGSKQFAWKGMPLYYYAQDKKAGDMSGDGIGGVWHIVKP